MLTKADSTALIKVLIAAAWADGELAQSEMNYIKSLAQKFRFSDQDWDELQPYLSDRPSEPEVRALFDDLLDRIGTDGQRANVIHHLEQMISADDRITAEEQDFLERYTQLLRQVPTGELMVRRIKGLFTRRKPEPVGNLDEFFQNKILFKLRRKVGNERVTPGVERLCMLAGLMAIVALADGPLEPVELDEIRTQLRVRYNPDDEILDAVMSIVAEEPAKGYDRAGLPSEYAAGTSVEERVRLLDILFAVAAADRSLTNDELEELRAISASIGLSHRQYIDAKLQTRPRE